MPSDEEAESIEVDLVLRAIHDRYGYDLRQYTRTSMRRRVLAAMTKSGVLHLGEFQHRILTERAFFSSVFDELTVQVSEMFRDPPFHDAFRRHVVPILRTYPQLKVWHAGCAGGEEAYAMAILLSEEHLYDRALIYATDVSPGAIERAREGVYSEDQVTGFATNHGQAGGKRQFDEHCSRAYGRAAIKESLRRNVVFFQHDLVSDHSLGEMNVIFCRNVLIYFTAELRQRVLSMFAQSLAPGGFLCLGSSERLLGEALGPFFEFAPGHRIYRLGES